MPALSRLFPCPHPTEPLRVLSQLRWGHGYKLRLVHCPWPQEPQAGGQGGVRDVGRVWGSLEVLAVFPVMPLMLAGQEVGEAVALALEQPDEVVGAVIPLLNHELCIVHLLLRSHHLCGEGAGRAQLGWAFRGLAAGGSPSCPDSRELVHMQPGATAQAPLPALAQVNDVAANDCRPLTDGAAQRQSWTQRPKQGRVPLSPPPQAPQHPYWILISPLLSGFSLQTAPHCRAHFLSVLPSARAPVKFITHTHCITIPHCQFSVLTPLQQHRA